MYRSSSIPGLKSNSWVQSKLLHIQIQSLFHKLEARVNASFSVVPNSDIPRDQPEILQQL
jgi:hypothetical protein